MIDQHELQRLADLEAIRRLLVDYARHLDDRDFTAYAGLFAPDGEWIGGFGTIRGREAIRTVMQERLGAAPAASSGGGHHLVTNVAIDVEGDSATGWSRWIFLTPGPEGAPRMAMSGQYDDVLAREEGHWRFQRRVVVTDAVAGDSAAR